MNRRLPTALAVFLLLLPLACGRATDRPAAPHVPAAVPPATGIEARVPAEWPHDLDGPVARGSRGAVASDDSIAAAVGLRVLRELDGNAVDAMIATTLALAVTYPEAGNIGGGGFMVIRTADGELASIDFREEAPAAASRDMFLGPDGELTDASLWSHRASGVPGVIDGLYRAHQRFGRLPWPDVVAPAIRLAEHGFPVNQRFHDVIAGRADRFRQYPGAAELLLPNDAPPEPGSVWRNPDIAATLRRMAEQGPAGFYRGRTADLIVEEMQRGGGLITHADLEAYEAKWREPVVFRYRGHQVVSMPPASSGGITIGMMAKLLEPYDMAALGWHSPAALHLTAEAMRRAFADRNHYLGDTDFEVVPRERLLSDAHAERRRESIDPDRATPSMRIAPWLDDDQPRTESVHTSHISVVDDDGAAVALTTTVNYLYGSGVIIPGAGFFMNNTMDDFAAKPGSPNSFGLVQGEVNAIEPGKRALSAMTPTIVLDARGQPVLITGARGGPRIISAVFQIVSNVLDYGMDLPAAVATPRIHHQHLPDALALESDGFTGDALRGLFERRHTLEVSGGVGVSNTILRTPDGSWTAMPDPRSSGNAALAY